jgi:hypothetical protein
VPGESSHLGERRVAPENDLVLRVTVSADHLVGTSRPGQVTHLRACVDTLQWLASEGVPESNSSVLSSSSRGQDPMLQT